MTSAQPLVFGRLKDKPEVIYNRLYHRAVRTMGGESAWRLFQPMVRVAFVEAEIANWFSGVSDVPGAITVFHQLLAKTRSDEDLK